MVVHPETRSTTSMLTLISRLSRNSSPNALVARTWGLAPVFSLLVITDRAPTPHVLPLRIHEARATTRFPLRGTPYWPHECNRHRCIGCRISRQSHPKSGQLACGAGIAAPESDELSIQCVTTFDRLASSRWLPEGRGLPISKVRHFPLTPHRFVGGVSGGTEEPPARQPIACHGVVVSIHARDDCDPANHPPSRPGWLASFLCCSWSSSPIRGSASNNSSLNNATKSFVLPTSFLGIGIRLPQMPVPTRTSSSSPCVTAQPAFVNSLSSPPGVLLFSVPSAVETVPADNGSPPASCCTRRPDDSCRLAVVWLVPQDRAHPCRGSRAFPGRHSLFACVPVFPAPGVLAAVPRRAHSGRAFLPSTTALAYGSQRRTRVPCPCHPGYHCWAGSASRALRSLPFLTAR